MTEYALDTNVVSEPTKDVQNPRVIAFLNEPTAQLWLPSVVVHEMEYGVQRCSNRRHRQNQRFDDCNAERQGFRRAGC